MRQVQPLFDELCDPFSSMTTLDGLPVSFLRNLSAFWSASEFFFYRSFRPPWPFKRKPRKGIVPTSGIRT